MKSTKIPAVAPIALEGFYSFNGMSFHEVMKRKFQMIFTKRPLTYVSEEGEKMVKECQAQKEAQLTAEKRKKRLSMVFNKPGK